VESAGVADLREALVGIELPADRARLLEYAVQRRVEPHNLDALQSLSDRKFESLDDVVDELLNGQAG
jgi:hypothetical protein